MFLPVVWLVLRRIARRDALAAGGGAEILRAQYAALGPMSAGERAVAIVFVAAAAAWIGGRPLAAWLGPDPAAMDAITAMTAALVLVLLGRLDAQALRRIPWGVVVLLGGSFAMVDAVSGSGLDRRIASGMGVIATWPAPAMFLAVAATAVFASAAASNTATATLMMPVLMGAVPRAFVVPMMGTAAIAMSCDFMLPAGTPPNAIVFGSGRVSLRAMVRVGFLLDVLAALFAGLWGWLGVRLILPAPGP
jgi:sodium-dependent dicarboxylate transporter 2/3/5